MAKKRAETKVLGEENPIPSSVSSWTTHMPEWLNTQYESHMVTKFEFNDVVLPKDMENGIYC
jgi:hypothetical protein